MKFVELIGSFCLGSSLVGIFGFFDGLFLAIAIICFLFVIKDELSRNPTIKPTRRK